MSHEMQGHSPTDETWLISRLRLEIVLAVLIIAFGAAIAWGATELDIGWSDRGPGSGYFPFWVGLIVMIGGLGTLAEAIMRRATLNHAAITVGQAKRALIFLWPMLAFLVIVSALGLYVGMALYILAVMVWQGKYTWLTAVSVSVSAVLFFFVVFEKLLKVGLKMGPIENWLGIH